MRVEQDSPSRQIECALCWNANNRTNKALKKSAKARIKMFSILAIRVFQKSHSRR